MNMLSQEQGQLLVRLARQRIEEQLGLEPTAPVDEADLQDPVLQEHRGIFVTLHAKNKELRGCIGSLAAGESIVDGVGRHALNAAFDDHRFSPVAPAELAHIQVEVSVLTNPEPLEPADEANLLHRLRPGRDGVILQGPGGASATFLPQVWRQLPVPEQFLGHLCRKAGLAEQAWRAGTLRFSVYQVQSFEEPLQTGSST
jgi:uncharacterized protein